LALTILTDYLGQLNPVTPTEVSLVHQFIHQQRRFLQREYLFNQAMSFRVMNILAKSVTLLPARMQRTLKPLRAEIKLCEDRIASEENVEIEPIPDPASLPRRIKQDLYEAGVSPNGFIPDAEHLQKKEERSHSSNAIRPASRPILDNRISTQAADTTTPFRHSLPSNRFHRCGLPLNSVYS